MSPETKLHIIYGCIILGYVFISVMIFLYSKKLQKRNFKREIDSIKKSFVDLIDHMNYVASENMLTLEEKTIELRELLGEISKKEENLNKLCMSTEKNLPNGNFNSNVNSSISSSYFDRTALKVKKTNEEISNDIIKETILNLQKDIEDRFNNKFRPEDIISNDSVNSNSHHSDYIKDIGFNGVESIVSKKTSNKTSKLDIRKQIRKLHDSGYSIDEIATKTKKNKGEINLILSFN